MFKLIPQTILSDSRDTSILIKLAILGLMIRMVVMPFTLHPDLLFINFFPSLLIRDGVFDIYSYLEKHFSVQISQLGWFYYPPMTYYSTGFFQFIFKPFTPLMTVWLSDVGAQISGGGGLAHHYANLSGSEQLFRNLFFLKLPYLFFDFATALTLLWIVPKKENAIKAFKLWMLNPVAIYASFIFGQFDIIPTFFVLLSIYLVKAKKKQLACFILGVGAAYKNFPFILLLPMVLLLEQSNIKRVKLVIFGILPYLLFFIPLYFSSDGGVVSVVFPDVIKQKFGGLGLWWAIAKKTMLVLGYILIFMHAFLNQKKKQNFVLLVDYYLMILLLLYAFLPISFHYFLWISPLFAIKASEDSRFLLFYPFMVVCLVVMTLSSQPLLSGVLTPVSAVFSGLPGLSTLVDVFLPFGILRQASVLCFMGLCLVLIIFLLKENNEIFEKK
jgi:hypothetical protein